MPSSQRLRKSVQRLAAGVLAIGLCLIVLRVFCLRIFQVTTGSMEPYIHGASETGFPGQRVLVSFGPLFSIEDLERFDLVVIDRGEGGAPIGKRVVGLPGERLQLVGGDVLVNGKRLAFGEVAPPAVEVFDWERDDFDESFHYKRSLDSPWQFDAADHFVLDGSKIKPGSESGMALLAHELADDVRMGDGLFQRGRHQVNDGALEVEVRAHDRLASGHLRLRLVEEGDVFEAEFNFDQGAVQVRILRYPEGEVLAEGKLSSAPTAWFKARFENRDNHLRLNVGTEGAGDKFELQLDADYSANRSFEAVLPKGLSSIAPRVAFGGDGLSFDFRGVRVTRDLFWTPTGPWGSRSSIQLGPDEYFLLGDNSANSKDGRYWGPTPAGEIIGRPIAIVGPWKQRRWL